MPPERDHRASAISSPETKVALYNTKARSYLKYAKRGIGQAELEWNSKASYEWQLHDIVSAARGRVHFALFNTRKNLYLVEQLKAGMGLGWYGEAPLSFSLSLNAQQITQGAGSHILESSPSSARREGYYSVSPTPEAKA